MQKLIAATIGVAFAVTAVPALAFWSDDDITVKVSNMAWVSNTVVTGASTGHNIANGGAASNNISGGNVKGVDHGNTAGNGPNKAVGGDGGFIATGNAISTSLVTNDVNDTSTKIKIGCGCEDSNDGDIYVKVRNKAEVGNNVGTFADTGINTADGGYAGNTVSGGSVKWAGDHNSAGNGPNEAFGGNGGEIWTGNADSLTSVVNIVNSTVTRIRR